MLCPWAVGYLADCLACSAAGVSGAGWCALLGRAAWCARGRRPAREPPALRASLGASSRSPARPCRRPRAPQPGPPAWAPPPTGTAVMLAGLAVPFMPAGLGLAHCATVSKWAAMGLCGMRSWPTACRRRVGVSSSASPLRVAMRSRFAVVSCPKCRPPRRKTLKTGCYGRSGLRFERIGTCHSALLAREPAIASGNPLCRTSTRYLERGRGCPRSYERVRVRIGGPTCGLEGWRVRERSHVRNVGGTCD